MPSRSPRSPTRVSYLEDGDWVVIDRATRRFATPMARSSIARAQVASFGYADRQGQPPPLHGKGDPRAARGRWPYAGELSRHERPSASRCRRRCLSISARLKRISISACGTAYYAGLVARYWFERFARLPVEVDIASEFRYRDVPLDAGDLAILFRSRARPRTRWRHCALHASTSNMCSPSSTCRPRPSPAKAT